MVKNFKLLWKLFFVFFKVGCFTFGGGLAMLPLIQKEVVDKQKWIDEEEILDVFALGQSLPGVIAINTSIFIGKKIGGLTGAIAAVFGVVLPAFASIIIIMLLLSGLEDNAIVKKVFSGIRAASSALILVSAIKIGKSAVKGKLGYVIALISFLIIVVFNISAVWAIVFGGVSGYLFYLFDRRNENG